MEPQSHPTNSHALRERREEIRRGLSRVNAAGVAVVLVTIALAIAAAVGAVRAGRQAELAREANQRARDELWKAYLAQARAGRLSGEVGRKAKGLEAIAAAAAIRPSLALRDEAIAHLALLDLEPAGVAWTNMPGLGFSAVDFQHERYLESDGRGTMQLRRIARPEEVFRLRTTNGPVRRADFSPDGRLLLAVHQNSVAVIWDLAAKTILFRRAGVAWARFNEAGEAMAVAGEDRIVRLIEVPTGRELASFQPEVKAEAGVFAPEGKLFAASGQKQVQVWEWESGRVREAFEMDRPATALAWRGDILAAGDGNGEVRLWNLVTKRTRRLPAHQNLVHHLFFDPRGEVLVSTSYDGSTKAWDPHTGRLLLTATHGFGLHFTPDGGRLLFGTQSGWSEWLVSPPTGFSRLYTASGRSLNVWHTDFSRDGQWLAATKENGVGLFRLADGARMFFQPVNLARAAFFLPDGTNLLTTSTRRIAFWPMATKALPTGETLRLGERQLVPLTNFVHLEPAVLSLDRKLLALSLSQSEAAIVDLETRTEILRITNAILPQGVSFSPDKRRLATGTFHGRGTRVWDAATGARVHDFNEGNASACFSPDGRYLVSAGSRSYRIFETEQWRLLHETAADSGSDLPNLAAFSADGGQMAFVKERNRVELLRVGDWRRTAALVPPDPQEVTWLAFSPDHRRLAVATSQDFVQLWDLGVLGERLHALGLGWDAPVESAGHPPATVAPPSSGVPHLILPLSVGVLVVMACTSFIRQRQRRLLAAYMQVDQLVEAQDRKLVAAQVEILQAQKMKALGTLAAGIAHDFNNLLSVIRLSNQLTGEATRGNQDIAENVAEVEQAVQQGKKVVRSMLGYSREDANDCGPFAVAELVEDTVGLLHRQFLGGIALTLELDHHAPKVRASRGRLEQCLLNLVVNASEAMDGHGTLNIVLRQTSEGRKAEFLRPRRAAQYLELRVTDSGPGIAPEVLPRIFEPFFSTKTRGATRGTGLGLSMVYTMAEQEGLGLDVESGPGRGSTFRILIPVDGRQ